MCIGIISPITKNIPTILILGNSTNIMENCHNNSARYKDEDRSHGETTSIISQVGKNLKKLIRKFIMTNNIISPDQPGFSEDRV